MGKLCMALLVLSIVLFVAGDVVDVLNRTAWREAELHTEAVVTPPQTFATEHVVPAEVAERYAELDRQDATPAVDTESTLRERIAALEAEVSRLQSLNAQVRLISAVQSFDPSLSSAQIFRLLDDSYLTEDSWLRMQFAEQVNPSEAASLLRDEPALRTELAELGRSQDKGYMQFQWPVDRDNRIQAFANRLAQAGLSSRFIESWKLSLADYL